MADPVLQTLVARFVSRELTFEPTNANKQFQVVPDNPLRAELIFSNAGSEDFVLSTLSGAPNDQGFLLKAGAAPLIMKFKDEGSWVQQAWYGQVLVMGGKLTVFTLDYHEEW